MVRAENITSAANPLLKEIRRAIARGSLTNDGLCVAESFHLLEEALRSDCQVKVVLAARSVTSAVEAHVRRLASVRVVSPKLPQRSQLVFGVAERFGEAESRGTGLPGRGDCTFGKQQRRAQRGLQLHLAAGIDWRLTC